MKLLKKFLALSAAVCVMLPGTAAQAAFKEQDVTVQFNNVNLYINGYLFDGPEIAVHEGMAYMPIKVLAEALDKDVWWSDISHSVNIADKRWYDRTARLHIYGHLIEDSQVVIHNGIEYAPVNALAEAMDLKVTRVNEIGAIFIDDNEMPGYRSGDTTFASYPIALGYKLYPYSLHEDTDGGFTWEVVYISSVHVSVSDKYIEEESTDETKVHEFIFDIPRDTPDGDFTVVFEQVSTTEEEIEDPQVLVLTVYVGAPAKPVIYLYPESETDVSVRLDYNGILGTTYPDYGYGWNVTAYPDGRLVNLADGLEYSYLFWEGATGLDYDLSKGFVVSGDDTAAFLREKLSYMGLTPMEYNEFIVYWLPLMEGNPYNLISFQEEAYTDNAKLDIIPEPDSILRVFMAFKPLEEFIEIESQKLRPFERTGFSVIEWGGAEIR